MVDNVLIVNALDAVNTARDALMKFLNPDKKPIGTNVAYPAWYASRQTWADILKGGYWNIDWKEIPGDQLNAAGYPKVWPAAGIEVKRLLSIPTGGFVKDSRVILTWEGTGIVNIAGGTDIVREDHKITFTIPSWEGKTRNKWLGISNVDNADPLRNMKLVDARPENVTTHQFSKEIVETLTPMHTLRFMDWNDVNGNIARTMANKPDPTSIARPHNAIENQIDLCNLTNSNFWFNQSWYDDLEYGAWAAKTVRERLKPHLKVMFELGNEVWNYQFKSAQDCLAEGTALKIVPTNTGYSHWQNYSRRFILAVKAWEDAFALERHRLIRVLGTQVAYAEVTRQELKYPGILDHIDAIAGAPYFSHDRKVAFTWEGLEADIERNAGFFEVMCQIARAAKPDILCYMYEGGQHELPTSLLPQADFEAIQRDPRMGTAYTKYLNRMAGISDLVLQYYDVGSMGNGGAWGLQEYGGQEGAPKKIAFDNFLKQ